MKYLATIIAVIFLKTCGASQDVAKESQLVNDTLETMQKQKLSGTYKVEMITDDSVSNELTLEFDESTNNVSGFAGCNRFFGTYTTDGNSITFSPMATTHKFCDETINNTERNMLQTLATVTTFQIKDNQLKLQNNDLVVVEATHNSNSKTMQALPTKIIYEATTRGFFEKIWIENNVLSYSNDRNLEEVITHNISDEQIEKLLSALQTVDAKTLPAVKAPSKLYQFDGAAMATLQIENGETSYKTEIFDHGNPPKAISDLVNKVLSLKKSMEKQ